MLHSIEVVSGKYDRLLGRRAKELAVVISNWRQIAQGPSGGNAAAHAINGEQSSICIGSYLSPSNRDF